MGKCIFALHAGTSGFTFLQNIVDGFQPVATFNSSGKSIDSSLRFRHT